jgi:hypothetical protein
MQCANLTDEQLWRAIAQNTEKLSALIRQQLELDDVDDPIAIHPGLRGDLRNFGSKFQREYRQYIDELQRRYPADKLAPSGAASVPRCRRPLAPSNTHHAAASRQPLKQP